MNKKPTSKKPNKFTTGVSLDAKLAAQAKAVADKKFHGHGPSFSNIVEIGLEMFVAEFGDKEVTR